MHTYKIYKDGFNIGMAKGKRNGIKYLESFLFINGVEYPRWGTWCMGVLKVTSPDHEFTIEQVK